MRILVVEDENKGASFIRKAWALRNMGAEVVVGNLLDLDAMHRVIAGGETMSFGMSVSVRQRSHPSGRWSSWPAIRWISCSFQRTCQTLRIESRSIVRATSSSPTHPITMGGTNVSSRSYKA